MSGGSYGYAYGKIEDLANEIRPTSPLRKAFKTHLRKVAKACHDIEWVDSGDYGPGDEDEAIRACLGKDGPRARAGGSRGRRCARQGGTGRGH